MIDVHRSPPKGHKFTTFSEENGVPHRIILFNLSHDDRRCCDGDRGKEC